MAKKKRELIGRRTREVRRRLCCAAATRSGSRKELFDLIEPFADYGFNAAHACAYGYIAYQTAYLMAHHSGRVHGGDPHVGEGRQGPQALLPVRLPAAWGSRSCRRTSTSPRHGLRARAGRPDAAIRYGLSAVRNVGEGAVGADHRRASRQGRRSPRSPTSAAGSSRRCSRSGSSSPSIYAGAFDSLGYARGGVQLVGEQPGTRCRRPSSPSARPRPRASSRCSAAAMAGARR